MNSSKYSQISNGTKLKSCSVMLLLILAVGTVGYRIIENWDWNESFYMTVITLSTVGLGGVHPLSSAGRMFTALLILSGVVTAAFAVTVILESMFQRQIGKILLILGIKESGGKMKGHTIICGYGRIGRATVREMLAGNDDSLVIIEKDYDTCKHIEKEHLSVVHGSAVDEDILEEAGLSKAVAVVAALPSDADNLFLVMTARNINPKLNIIARSEDEANATKLLKAGATRVVSPYSAGGRNIFTLLTAPAVTDVTEMFASDGQPQMKVQQIRVGKDSNLAGKTIGNTYVQKTIKGIVLAIRRPDGNNIFNPDPSRLVAVGDTLYVVRPGRHNY